MLKDFLDAAEVDVTDLNGDAVLSVANASTPGITWTGIYGAFPVQAFGASDDGAERAYFRFRSNEAQLYVGAPSRTEADDPQATPDDPPRLYSEVVDVFPGRDYAGELEAGEFLNLLQELYDTLAPLKEWPRGTRRQRLHNEVRALLKQMGPDEG